MEQYKKQVFANFSGWTDLVMAHLTKLRTLKILNLNYQSDFLCTDIALHWQGQCQTGSAGSKILIVLYLEFCKCAIVHAYYIIPY